MDKLVHFKVLVVKWFGWGEPYASWICDCADHSQKRVDHTTHNFKLNRALLKRVCSSIAFSQPGSQGDPWPDAEPWQGQDSQLSLTSTQGVDAFD